jgi:hypothetical protein
MKILLRDQGTGRYYRSGSDWTCLAKEAAAFCCGSRAFGQALKLGLPNVEVVYTFEDPKYNFTICLKWVDAAHRLLRPHERAREPDLSFFRKNKENRNRP